MTTEASEKNGGQPASPSRLPTLGERLSWITETVAPIDPTGTNQFSKPAMSIEDIENAIRPLLARAGVVTRWSLVSDEHFKDGNQTLWKTLLHVTVYRDDDPSDCIDADWADVGTSPTAAHSFTVKGYYRRLFHLADATDELITTAGPPAKAKTVQQAVKQIAATYGLPDQQAPGAISSQPKGKETDPTPASAELTGELDMQALFTLARTLKTPRTVLEVSNKVSKQSYDAVRRELILAHSRDHGAACEHVAGLAGFLVAGPAIG